MSRLRVVWITAIAMALIVTGTATVSVGAADTCAMITRLGDQAPICTTNPTPMPMGGMPAAAMPMGGMPSSAGMSPTMPAQMQFDQMFIDMMVPHHMSAVAMAQIALSRAEHPEIKTLATNIIASQTREIAQMKQWRKAWYGSDQTPAMDQMPMMPGMMDMMDPAMMAHMDMMADINNLKTATPFDKAFINAMIPHHQMAIMAAKMAQQQATHPEIKTLAASIIADQQKEIDQMQQWLKAWYGQ